MSIIFSSPIIESISRLFSELLPFLAPRPLVNLQLLPREKPFKKKFYLTLLLAGLFGPLNLGGAESFDIWEVPCFPLQNYRQ